MSYFNTTNLSGSTLKKAESKAERQEKMVLSHFIANQKPMTPLQVYREMKFNPNDTPVTSIRRAIRVLTKSGKLTKTKTKVVEMFGAVNYQWVLSIAI